jgi:hypothetical protein
LAVGSRQLAAKAKAKDYWIVDWQLVKRSTQLAILKDSWQSTKRSLQLAVGRNCKNRGSGLWLFLN